MQNQAAKELRETPANERHPKQSAGIEFEAPHDASIQRKPEDEAMPPVAISKEVCERDHSAGAILDTAASEKSCTEKRRKTEANATGAEAEAKTTANRRKAEAKAAVVAAKAEAERRPVHARLCRVASTGACRCVFAASLRVRCTTIRFPCMAVAILQGIRVHI